MMTVFWMLRKNLGAKLFFLPALAFWLVALDVTAAEARFIQDRFAIGYWVGPQTSENLETRYREIADANFTLVLGTPGMTPAAQLELCDKLGLRAIVRIPGLVGHPFRFYSDSHSDRIRTAVPIHIGQ